MTTLPCSPSAPSSTQASTAPKKKHVLSNSSPTQVGEAMDRPLSSDQQYIEDDQYHHAEVEMRGQWFEVSVDDFFTELPQCLNMPSVKESQKKLREVAYATSEPTMYIPFIDAMEPFIDAKWELVNTSNNVDSTSLASTYFAGIKPGISLYHRECGRGKIVTDSSKADVYGEFKLLLKDDPFYEESKYAQHTRGQIALYINAIQSCQPRTRVFFFFVVAGQYRLLSHSRIGCRYTPLMSYTETNYLHRFFWTLTHKAPCISEARGHDTFLSRLCGDSGIDFEATAALRNRLNKPNAPIFKVTIDGETFYVSDSFTLHHLFSVGRGTRCYIAWRLSTKKFVLLKSTWRDMSYPAEHETYDELHNSDVRYILRHITHIDVPGSLHKTPDLPEQSGQVLGHYILVLDEIGEELQHFPSTHVFVTAVLHAIIAHSDAVHKAQILHRDVSAGNILIVKLEDGSFEGRLIDWERSAKTTSDSPRSTERTGTFQFMAVVILDNPSIRQITPHDLESFVWVLTHTSLLHATSGLTPKARGDDLLLFEYFPSAPGSNIKSLVYHRKQFADNLELQSKPLTLLIKSLLAVVRDSYCESCEWEDARLAAINDAMRALSKFNYLPETAKGLPKEIVEHLNEHMNEARVECAEDVNKEFSDRRTRISNHDWFIATLKSFLNDEEWKAQQDHWVANEIEMHSNPKTVIKGGRKGELRFHKDVSVK